MYVCFMYTHTNHFFFEDTCGIQTYILNKGFSSLKRCGSVICDLDNQLTVFASCVLVTDSVSNYSHIGLNEENILQQNNWDS